MRKLLIGVLMLVLILLGAGAGPGRAQERMPALHQYVKTDEAIRMLPCGVLVGLRGYNSIGHEGDAWYKIVAAYRGATERPFIMLVWTDENDPESEVTAYYDYNRDGSVDETKLLPVGGVSVSLLCDAYQRSEQF